MVTHILQQKRVRLQSHPSRALAARLQDTASQSRHRNEMSVSYAKDLSNRLEGLTLRLHLKLLRQKHLIGWIYQRQRGSLLLRFP